MATKSIPIEFKKDIDTAVHALAKSVQSILGDDECDKDEKASWLKESLAQYQKYMGELIPAGIKKAVTAAVEVAKIKSTAAADDPAEDLFPGGKRPLFFNASGYGPTHQKLWNLFDDIRRQKGPAQSGSAFEEAWRSLTDAERQTVRDEEKQAEAARQAQAAKEQNEREREMNKVETVMLKAAHAIRAGTIENTVRASTWHGELRKFAAARQEDGETIERTVARLVQTDADARALFKASINGVADDAPMALVTPAPVLKQGTAYARLHDIGAGFMAADPKLTRAQAFAKAFDANPELAQRSKTESVFA